MNKRGIIRSNFHLKLELSLAIYARRDCEVIRSLSALLSEFIIRYIEDNDTLLVNDALETKLVTRLPAEACVIRCFQFQEVV